MSVSAAVGLDQVLARHGVDLSGAEFVAELDAGLSRTTMAAAAPLSATEVSFLRDHAGPQAAAVLDQDPPAAAREVAASVATQLAASMRGTLSIVEAALLLGVDRSRISQRISHGSLWAFPVGRAKRLPRWQFTAQGKILPGLTMVVAAIPRGLSPESVAALMEQPQAELGDKSPVSHLAAGGDPGVVADLLTELGLW